MSSDNIDDDHFDRSFWQKTTSTNGSSKILLLTSVSFCIITVIFFGYHLYARFVLHRRRPAFQGLTFSVTSQPPQRGLEKVIIASLPTFVVNGGDDVSTTECAVCLSSFEEKDTARMLPNCKHVFHVTCVDTWLTSCSTCPICRTEVEPSQGLLPEPREGPNGVGASSSDNKSSGASFRRMLTRERSSSRGDHSHVDQERVLDIERQWID
ncbi:unnamed protein product [Eruca vesicaria subsp. sativa]|uniref:RING-type E3 ubiquitin transferase n=1 Tax=Eruca vesicaria subsp. sativa TaxID=29727 RepID=A0ABC8LNN4_ERUVS|nr:unnamed protein product [Eruca vesicaria subsp. sativa]